MWEHLSSVQADSLIACSQKGSKTGVNQLLKMQLYFLQAGSLYSTQNQIYIFGVLFDRLKFGLQTARLYLYKY